MEQTRAQELETQSISLIRRVMKGYNAIRISERAAALTFLTLVALVPLLAFMIAGAQFFSDKGFFETQVTSFMQDIMGDIAPLPLGELLHNASSLESYLLTSLIGAGIILWSVTTMFLNLRATLARIFSLGEIEGAVVRKTIKERLLALVYMIILFLLLLLVMISRATMQALFAVTTKSFAPYVSSNVAAIAGVFSAFLLSLTFFSLVYGLVSVRVRVRDALLGGLIAASLFTLINVLFSAVLVSKTVLNYYGSMGVFVVFGLYLYYVYIAFFVGALAARHHRIISK